MTAGVDPPTDSILKKIQEVRAYGSRGPRQCERAKVIEEELVSLNLLPRSEGDLQIAACRRLALIIDCDRVIRWALVNALASRDLIPREQLETSNRKDFEVMSPLLTVGGWVFFPIHHKRGRPGRQTVDRGQPIPAPFDPSPPHAAASVGEALSKHGYPPVPDGVAMDGLAFIAGDISSTDSSSDPPNKKLGTFLAQEGGNPLIRVKSLMWALGHHIVLP